MAWMFSAVVVVAAAAVVITLVLTRGNSSPQATGSSTPVSPSTRSSGRTASTPMSNSSSPRPTITAPTTDVAPDNVEAAACGKNIGPELVAVSIVTVLSDVVEDSPDSYGKGVLDDCVSAPVRTRLSRLYGVEFGFDYSADLTGGDNAGPTARYRVGNKAGTATLTLDFTRQQDGHYELTDFSYG